MGERIDFGTLLKRTMDGYDGTANLHERVETRRARRRHHKRLTVGAAVVLLAVASAAMTRVLDTDDGAPVIADDGPVITYSGDGGGFRLDVSDVPASPLADRYDYSTVWTGRELIVWGGYSSDNDVETPVNSGAAYDPSRSTWRTVPDAPISGRAGHAAQWTGSEMLVWGGRSSDGSTVGAAYSPSDDTWRLLSDAPITNRFGAISAWTGDELIVWGGANDAAEPEPAILDDGAVYDVATDRWRVMLPAPIGRRAGGESGVWLQGRLIVGGGEAGDGGDYDFASYDPAADQWTEIPAPPDNADGEPTGYFAVLATDGDVVYVVDRLHGGFSELDVATSSWRSLAPISDQNPYTVPFTLGSTLAVLTGPPNTLDVAIEVYDRDRNSWHRLESGLVNTSGARPIVSSTSLHGDDPLDARDRAFILGVTREATDAERPDGVLVERTAGPLRP